MHDDSYIPGQVLKVAFGLCASMIVGGTAGAGIGMQIGGRPGAFAGFALGCGGSAIAFVKASDWLTRRKERKQKHLSEWRAINALGFVEAVTTP